MYIVYGLEDQRKHEIFYVGITDNIQARYLQHLRCDGSNPTKDAIIRAMVEAGYLPLPRTLQLVADLDQAKRRAAYWIRHFSDLGIPLIQDETVLYHVGKQDHTTEIVEQKGSVSGEIRETIQRMNAMKMSHRRIARAVGLSGRKYKIYRQVCAEMGIVIGQQESGEA